MTSELMDAVESLGRTIAVRDRFEAVKPPMIQHTVRREGDEWACACGMRWGADEQNPHGR